VQENKLLLKNHRGLAVNCAATCGCCGRVLARKLPGATQAVCSNKLLRFSDLDLKKRVIWGEKTHDYAQCHDQETKYKTTCETPKIHKNAQILRRELRTWIGAKVNPPIQVLNSRRRICAFLWIFGVSQVLGVCFPQACWSAGCRFAADRSCLE